MDIKDKDTRRIPTGENIMDDKRYNDLIYAYMQSVSNRVPEKEDRYVWKNNFKKKEVAKILKINFRTFQRKFNHLIDNGYVIETEDTYELPKISKWNFYIPLDTLRYLINSANEDVITVYAYLGQMKKSIDEENKRTGENKRAYFTESKLLMFMGYKINRNINGEVIEMPSNNSKDWSKINDIITCLKNNGLLECKEEKELYNGKYIYKTYYTINTKVKNIK